MVKGRLRVQQSKFNSKLTQSLKYIAYNHYPRIKEMFDVGFVRFREDTLDSIYLSVLWNSNNPGFVKFDNKEGEFEINSAYFTISNELELRVNIQGDVICMYVSSKEKGKTIIRKIEYGLITDTYEIVKNQVANFENYVKVLRDMSIIEKKDSAFKYFTKDKSKMVYLQIYNKGSELSYKTLIGSASTYENAEVGGIHAR
jgi:hypothetical protein